MENNKANSNNYKSNKINPVQENFNAFTKFSTPSNLPPKPDINSSLNLILRFVVPTRSKQTSTSH
uniref:Uncharacterized protein n=1 Tax=Cucumis melo TaxID=3656 RepID=A0A9I9EAY6_CUCME